MGNTGAINRDEGDPKNDLEEINEVSPGILDGTVINLTWAQLQPTPCAVMATALDPAIAIVRPYNQQHPQTPLAVKLRIWHHDPDWVKRIGGDPITIVDKDGSKAYHTKTIGRFWSAAYGEAWRHLQSELARRYDSEPLIREVTNTSCSALTGSPSSSRRPRNPSTTCCARDSRMSSTATV